MNTQEPRASLPYRILILNRLLELYLSGATLPGDAEKATPITIPLLQRLYRYVLTEGYGQ